MHLVAARTLGVATVLLTTTWMSAFVPLSPNAADRDDLSATQERVPGPQARLVMPDEVPLTGEGFPVRGRLRTVTGRPVQLQVQRRSGWRTVKVSATRKGGRFRFDEVALARTAQVRVRAPKWKQSHRVQPALVSRPVSVEVVSVQSASLVVLPGVAQHGRNPRAPGNETQLVAQFAPVREGREVVLQRQTGGGWEPVQDGRQDGSGSVDFRVSTQPDTYRVVALPVSGSTWRTSRAVTNSVEARSYAVLFEDTFSGPVLDPAKWVDQMKDSRYPASNRACSRISPSTRWVTEGVLHMGIAPNPTMVGSMCEWSDGRGSTGLHEHMWNTQVMTRGLFEFRYGFAAARMKVQPAKGMHSAFWMQPFDIPNGPPALGTEIDVMEFFGDTGRARTGVGAFVHWYENGVHQVRGDTFPAAAALKPSDEEWWDAFHVFSVEWTPTAYIFRVDGREFHRETVAISQTPEYLLLSMLTADYEYQNLTVDEWTQTAQVDWVRVWSP